MHDLLISVLLGVVEGVTEFLPISSTAHLRIAQIYLFNIQPDDAFWKMFAIVIQLGAVLCLPVYFQTRIRKFVASFPRGQAGDRNWLTHPLSLVMIACVCTIIPTLLAKKLVAANLENLRVIGGSLVIGGAIMWAVDALATRPTTNQMESMSLPQAIWIGLIQTLSAIFPGTSRSMATIAAGQLAGLSRASALEFSFFLSMPTMAAACVYDLYKTLRPSHAEKSAAPIAPLHMSGHEWVVLAVGFVVSFIVALIVVAWFMRWVTKRGFVPFAIYRIVAGLLVLLAVSRSVSPVGGNPQSTVESTHPTSYSVQGSP